eukprot:s636_g41.t1
MIPPEETMELQRLMAKAKSMPVPPPDVEEEFTVYDPDTGLFVNELTGDVQSVWDADGSPCATGAMTDGSKRREEMISHRPTKKSVMPKAKSQAYGYAEPSMGASAYSSLVQLDLVCRHLKTELWPRLERAGAQSLTLSTLGTGSRARSAGRDLEVECSQEGRQIFEEFLDKVCQEREKVGEKGQGKAICMAKRLRKAIDADALLGRGAALFVLCSVPADAAECEQLLCRGQFTLQITGVLGGSWEDPEICYERLIAAAAPGSALHLWFGEDYWNAFRAARRRQLESLSEGDAQDSLACSDGEVVSGEMLELRVLERLMRECYVDEQRCEEELKIMSQVLAKELCEAQDVKAARQSPRGFAPELSSSSLQLEPEHVPHSVGLGELADIAFSWTAMGVSPQRLVHSANEMTPGSEASIRAPMLNKSAEKSFVGDVLARRAILSIEMNMFVGECCFLMLSRMNHSCFPNVVYMSDKQQFRALRPIQRGEELLHSYLGRELLLPTELRRRLLWRSKCFECQCERCVAQEDPMRTVACSFCAEGKEKYQVIFQPGIWLRADPSLQGKQLSFLTVGTSLQGKGVMKNNWLQVQAEVGCGWVLLDGRSLVPPLRQMLCVRVDANGQPCCDSFDGSPLPTWPGRRLWHAAASQLLPPDDVQTPVADDETEEEAFARDVLNDLRLEHLLPCAAFEEGSARCSFDVGSGTWRCSSCGQQAEASLLATERLLGRLAERTFFSPKMTPALGNVSGAAMNVGANLKMVKRLFVRQAFELSGACAGVLGHRHWSVQWARLFLVDLVISRLSYGTGKGRDLGLLMCQALQELWSWLKALHLSHDPSCFLLTRTLEAQRLLGNVPDPDVREQLQRDFPTDAGPSPVRSVCEFLLDIYLGASNGDACDALLLVPAGPSGLSP